LWVAMGRSGDPSRSLSGAGPASRRARDFACGL